MHGIPFISELVRAIRNTEFEHYPALPLLDPAGPVKCQSRRNDQDVQFHIGHTYIVKEALKRQKHSAIYECDQSPVLGSDGRQIAWRWVNDRLPSIFMPHAYARDWVRIIKVERSTLGAMTPLDLVYEGLNVTNAQMDQLYPDGWGAKQEEAEYRLRWKNLWEYLNGQGTCKPSTPVMVYHFIRARNPV